MHQCDSIAVVEVGPENAGGAGGLMSQGCFSQAMIASTCIMAQYMQEPSHTSMTTQKEHWQAATLQITLLQCRGSHAAALQHAHGV